MRDRGFGSSISGINPVAMRKVGQGEQSYWCSLGTVCTIDQDGVYDFEDKRAFISKPEGVTVDVRLEPLDIHVPCTLALGLAGDVTMLGPIRPGSLVLVECPGGQLTTPVITAIVHSRSQRQPLGNDRKPRFNNDRFLLHAKNVPIDVRTEGGSALLLDQHGNAILTGDQVKLGDDGASHPIPKGDTQSAALNSLANSLVTYAAAIAAIADPFGTATAALALAVGQFTSRQDLSSVSKTK